MLWMSPSQPFLRPLTITYTSLREGHYPNAIGIQPVAEVEVPDYAKSFCHYLPGAPIVEFVGGWVLKALQPAALELSLEASEYLEKEREELDGLWRKRLERASYEADRAGRHYRLIEPENRLVARQLAREWEEKVEAQRKLQEDYRRFLREQPRPLSEAERESIRHLARDIPALWHSSETTTAERKGIVRQIVERVLVENEGKSERLHVSIEWVGGSDGVLGSWGKIHSEFIALG
jgi:hypothetical protein